MIARVAEIAALAERIRILGSPEDTLLHRRNRIQSIHSSLAIEQNTLSEEQVTAVLRGERVLAAAQEASAVSRELPSALQKYWARIAPHLTPDTRLRNAKVQEWCSVSPATANRILNQLCAASLLDRHGAGKARRQGEGLTKTVQSRLTTKPARHSAMAAECRFLWWKDLRI